MCRVRCWKSSSRASSRKPVLTSREAIRQLAGRLIAGKTDVRWDEDGAPDVTITFSDSDVEALTEALDNFVGKDLPKLTQNVSLKTARCVLRRLKKNWPEERFGKSKPRPHSKPALPHRWGKGLDLLRMLLTNSREFGEEAHAKARRSRARSSRYRTDVLLRLHACACQVVGEIVKLMESGPPTARWRAGAPFTRSMSLSR
jgi:hypothetical protein